MFIHLIEYIIIYIIIYYPIYIIVIYYHIMIKAKKVLKLSSNSFILYAIFFYFTVTLDFASKFHSFLLIIFSYGKLASIQSYITLFY